MQWLVCQLPGTTWLLLLFLCVLMLSQILRNVWRMCHNHIDPGCLLEKDADMCVFQHIENLLKGEQQSSRTGQLSSGATAAVVAAGALCHGMQGGGWSWLLQRATMPSTGSLVQGHGGGVVWDRMHYLHSMSPYLLLGVVDVVMRVVLGAWCVLLFHILLPGLSVTLWYACNPKLRTACTKAPHAPCPVLHSVNTLVAQPQQSCCCPVLSCTLSALLLLCHSTHATVVVHCHAHCQHARCSVPARMLISMPSCIVMGFPAPPCAPLLQL